MLYTSLVYPVQYTYFDNFVEVRLIYPCTWLFHYNNLVHGYIEDHHHTEHNLDHMCALEYNVNIDLIGKLGKKIDKKMSK